MVRDNPHLVDSAHIAFASGVAWVDSMSDELDHRFAGHTQDLELVRDEPEGLGRRGNATVSTVGRAIRSASISVIDVDELEYPDVEGDELADVQDTQDVAEESAISVLHVDEVESSDVERDELADIQDTQPKKEWDIEDVAEHLEGLSFASSPDVEDEAKNAWSRLVHVWKKYEQSRGSESRVGRLGAVSRPIAIYNWMQNHRPAGTPEEVEADPDFGKNWLEWWTAINPEWRCKDWVLTSDKASELAEWKQLDKRGPAGSSLRCIRYLGGLLKAGKIKTLCGCPASRTSERWSMIC
ncbi:hypothetical protein A0H81_14166 [Grifola frondosa]|uniref:Uncharacterized protein n=1 Tax=Grifola frondosa TaxID=5627 RepID=A0A1C7LMK2_GRIFR|nr:hypothetical protein A0H81_14166 [Grifola frondosa]